MTALLSLSLASSSASRGDRTLDNLAHRLDRAANTIPEEVA